MTRHHPPKASPQPIDILMASGAIKPLTAIEVGDEYQNVFRRCL